jgi:hypothetical protein
LRFTFSPASFAKETHCHRSYFLNPLLAMRFPILALLACSLAPLSQAENWPQFRGPTFNGASPEKDLPATWTKETVKWTAPLPGPSGATPAIWGDSIFVISPDAQKNLLLLCLDRKDGKPRWQHQLSIGDITKGRGNMASPSPVTDGKTVFALVGNGDLAALDFTGKVLWKRQLGADYGRFAYMWLYGSSPLLFEGKLYVQVLQRNPAPGDYPGLAGGDPARESYLLALDPATGKTLWKHVRPSDALGESQESYATPIPHLDANGKAQLVIVGADYVTGHDPATGAELWRGSGINPKRRSDMRVVPSPISAAGLAIAAGPKKEPILAFRTDAKGDVTTSGLAWKIEDRSGRMSARPRSTMANFLSSTATPAPSCALTRRPAPKNGKAGWTPAPTSAAPPRWPMAKSTSLTNAAPSSSARRAMSSSCSPPSPWATPTAPAPAW